MKKTSVKMGNPIIVSVEEEGGTVISQDISQEMIDAMAEEMKLPADAATQFIITYFGCNLRNLGNDEAAQKEFNSILMKKVTESEEWALKCLSVFSGTLLPLVVEVVEKAEKSGQDPVTAVSVALEFPMEAAKPFVACAVLMRSGVTAEQIDEILLAGMKGESAESIAERYGITDEKLKDL